MVRGFEQAQREYESKLFEGDYCEPEVIRAEKQYEPDGYSMDYIYNCEECDHEECEYWEKYNK